jgi:single stranded DNA-binding protein
MSFLVAIAIQRGDRLENLGTSGIQNLRTRGECTMSMSNLVMIEGRLGKTPVLRYTTENKPVANLSVAVSNDYKDKHTGEWVHREPDWVEVTVWGKLAETCADKATAGRLISVQGRLTTKKNNRKIQIGTGKSQKEHTIEYQTLGIVASQVRFFESTQSHVEEEEFEAEF